MGETDDLEWDDDKDGANQSKHLLPLALATLVFDGRPRVERLSANRPTTRDALKLSSKSTDVCYSACSRGEMVDAAPCP